MPIKAGVVSEVLAEQGAVRVTLPDGDEVSSNALPVLQRNTKGNLHYHLPDVGEQVYIATDEDGEDGCVLGSIYSEADPPPCNEATQYVMIFEDKTSVKYDRKAHLMEIKFDDNTRITYDASAHALKLSVSSNGTINVECQGATSIVSQRVISISAQESIALSAPTIALNTASLTCLNPNSTTGYCAAKFKGNVDVESQKFEVKATSMNVTAPLNLQGSLTATGSVIDGGSNTNHHTHSQYQLK